MDSVTVGTCCVWGLFFCFEVGLCQVRFMVFSLLAYLQWKTLFSWRLVCHLSGLCQLTGCFLNLWGRTFTKRNDCPLKFTLFSCFFGHWVQTVLSNYRIWSYSYWVWDVRGRLGLYGNLAHILHALERIAWQCVEVVPEYIQRLLRRIEILI